MQRKFKWETQGNEVTHMKGSHLKGKSEHQKKIFFLTNEMNHTEGKDIERKIYDIFQQLERKNMKWRTMIKCGEINNKIRTNTERKQQRQPIDLRWRDGDVRK